MYTDAPYVITPDPESDNGPAIIDALASGYRWIQINGSSCPIGTRVDLNDASGQPYDGLILEPAPGVGKVTIDSTGIGRNPEEPTDPSYAAIDYQGWVRPASFMTAEAAVGANMINVDDITQYANGQWIIISSANTDFSSMPLPTDGPMEVRQIIARRGSTLTLDRVLKRVAPTGSVVATCRPIQNVFIRDLEFTGNSAIGLHLHYAQHCTIERITSSNWSGRCMLLIDNGGAFNTVVDSYCTGIEPGIGPTQNTWGVVVEGQDSTRIINSGGEFCGEGMGINYSIDTISIDARASRNTVNVGVHTSSIRSGFLRPRASRADILNTVITPECVDCYMVDVQPWTA
ncbi:hypothetical protein DXU77_15560 [Pseudomonas lactis]|uniref:hypothetical protein n=1 Tax=Pseudomonas lactis TaxID=1615674 RepID=UPI001294EF95|nr:hypothetical protein [Pseudomonas lactis]MQB16491.1 hypothetical protein [Pseudomonas lactis]